MLNELDSFGATDLTRWYRMVANDQQRQRLMLGCRFEETRHRWSLMELGLQDQKHRAILFKWFDDQRVVRAVDRHVRQYLLLAWRRREAQCGVFQYICNPVASNGNSSLILARSPGQTGLESGRTVDQRQRSRPRRGRCRS